MKASPGRLNQVLAVASLLVLTVSADFVAAQAPPPLADANCDDRSTAADLTAAVTVAQDTTAFRDCRAADQFRNHQFDPLDEERLLDDIFNRREPEWTPTPSGTPTGTPTPTATGSATPSPTITATPSQTITPTPPPTSTRSPSATPASTHTSTSTRTPSVTPTPTGFARQLAGDWQANWQQGSGSVCYLNGHAWGCPLCVPDTAYRVTAVYGKLDVLDLRTGETLGRGLTLAASGSTGTVSTTFSRTFDNLCYGVRPEQVFAYTFTFQTNGTGSAEVSWNYGFNTNCAVCSPDDSATLYRVAGP